MTPPVIEYQKVMTEVVFINLPAPEEPTLGMSGVGDPPWVSRGVSPCDEPGDKSLYRCDVFEVEYTLSGSEIELVTAE